MRDPLRVPDRVLHREHASPRVPKHGDGLEPELAPHPLHVLDLRPQADVPGPDALGRPAAAALVVVDEAERAASRSSSGTK